VHDAPDPVGPLLTHNGQGALKGAAAVDEQRPAQLTRQAHLGAKGLLLQFQGDAVQRIEADFADGHAVLGHVRQPGQHPIVCQVSVHGMNAAGGMDAVVQLRQGNNALPIGRMDPGHDKLGHPCLARLGHHLAQFAAERFQVQVAVAVDQPGSRRLYFPFLPLHGITRICCVRIRHMTATDGQPEGIQLSVIIPVLNEAVSLPVLLDSLALQQDIRFEVLLCDGGSSDGSRHLVRERARQLPYPVTVVEAGRGRGRQMNAGAVAARGACLLFLHADSCFEHPQSLAAGLKTLAAQRALAPPGRLLAARFGLRFRHSRPGCSLAYFYYEAKARLNRMDCIRGDQGVLITRDDFAALGGFCEALPFLEDIRCVEQVCVRGEWLLLPHEVTTSARRFETEGLLERQVVNAIIVNAIVTGWDEFFQHLPVYRCHGETGRLLLLPFLDGVARLIRDQPAPWRGRFWRTTGAHVAANAWQLFWWWDVASAYRNGLSPGAVKPQMLTCYERHLARLFRSALAGRLAQALVWLWFHGLRARLRLAATGTSRTD